MPSLFSTLRPRKTKSHNNENTLKRSLTGTTTTTTPPLSTRESKSSSDSGSSYSQANAGGVDTTTTTTALSSSPSTPPPPPPSHPPPPIDYSSERGQKGSDNDLLSTLAPSSTPKNLSQPDLNQVAVVRKKDNPLMRKCSRVSFSDMKFGGTTMLGGRKSQQHRGGGGMDDKDRSWLSDTKTMTTQVSAPTVDGRGEEKEVVPPPIHGIMKTATNVSVGAGGMHSVRFTLDLPPKLDLSDLSLSGEEKVGDGGGDDGKDVKDGVVKGSSRWGRRTEEAVLDRSMIVSTEFDSCEDEGGGKVEGRKEDEDDHALKNPNDKAVSISETVLDEQQRIQRGYSHTSSISTLECEPSFTICRLEDLAVGVEPIRSHRRALPVIPTLGRVPSSQGERAFPPNEAQMKSYKEIDEAFRNALKCMNDSSSTLTRKGRGSNNGCVSA